MNVKVLCWNYIFSISDYRYNNCIFWKWNVLDFKIDVIAIKRNWATAAAASVFEFVFEFADADAVVVASASAFVFVIVTVYGYRPHAFGCGRIRRYQYL